MCGFSSLFVYHTWTLCVCVSPAPQFGFRYANKTSWANRKSQRWYKYPKRTKRSNERWRKRETARKVATEKSTEPKKNHFYRRSTRSNIITHISFLLCSIFCALISMRVCVCVDCFAIWRRCVWNIFLLIACYLVANISYWFRARCDFCSFLSFFLVRLRFRPKIMFLKMIYEAMKEIVTDEVNKIKFIDGDYWEVLARRCWMAVYIIHGCGVWESTIGRMLACVTRWCTVLFLLVFIVLCAPHVIISFCTFVTEKLVAFSISFRLFAHEYIFFSRALAHSSIFCSCFSSSLRKFTYYSWFIIALNV